MKKEFIEELRKYFPILNTKINGHTLSYLDNAALTQVPIDVINSFSHYYSSINANVHRGAYYLSEASTEKYENTRSLLKIFFNGESEKNFIFVKGTTEGINLVAHSFVKPLLESGDNVVVSQMEHHSNIVPWYIICNEKKAKLNYIPILIDGTIDYSFLDIVLTNKTKLLSITHISNSLGTINNLKKIIQYSHSKNIPVLIDGAQSFSDCVVNLKELNCDFYVCSSHKMHGPNGVGILYAKTKFLNMMVPYQGGGDMIKSVSFSNILWNDIPYKFEAGTPSISNIIAFGDTIKFLMKLDLTELFSYKKSLFEYTCNRLLDLDYLHILGTPSNNSSIISFLIDKIHPHDFATIANYYGVAVRTGHHCSMPVMDFYNISSSIRVSLSFYNNYNDIDKLMTSILHAKKIFS